MANAEMSQSDKEVNRKAAHKQLLDKIVSATPPKEPVDITLEYVTSNSTLKGYTTLDREHIHQIGDIVQDIQSYVRDTSRDSPLNILLEAPPGSGKSHFVKCLAEKLSSEHVRAVTFNMSGMRDVEDMVPALDSIRNLKAVDKFPLLFLDEFDTSKTNYGLLLPLLLDGEIAAGHRQLKVGRIVIVLAGSTKEISTEYENSRNVTKASSKREDKLLDLMSRINGGRIKIPELDDIDADNPENRDRRVDKVCISISLLKRRFGEQLESVPWALIRFIVETKLRYGVRSINQMVSSIPPLPKPKILTLNDLSLPFNIIEQFNKSPLLAHIISPGGAEEIIGRFQEVAKCDQQIAVKQLLLAPEDSLDRGINWTPVLVSAALDLLRNLSGPPPA